MFRHDFLWKGWTSYINHLIYGGLECWIRRTGKLRAVCAEIVWDGWKILGICKREDAIKHIYIYLSKNWKGASFQPPSLFFSDLTKAKKKTTICRTNKTKNIDQKAGFFLSVKPGALRRNNSKPCSACRKFHACRPNSYSARAFCSRSPSKWGTCHTCGSKWTNPEILERLLWCWMRIKVKAIKKQWKKWKEGSSHRERERYLACESKMQNNMSISIKLLMCFLLEEGVRSRALCRKQLLEYQISYQLKVPRFALWYEPSPFLATCLFLNTCHSTPAIS